MIALEHIREGDWGAVERMRETLEALVLDTGGRSLGVRIGQDSLHWQTGQNRSDTRVGIAHGLGRVPIFIGALAADAGAPFLFAVHAFDADQDVFSLRGFFDGANVAAAPADLDVTWAVIG